VKIGLIVEGHGEVHAVPILVGRIAERVGVHCEARQPLRVPRSSLVKDGELERAVTLMGNKVGPDGGLLVLLDADDDPACRLGPALLARAQAVRPDVPVGVVLAVREYEAWLLAGIQSLRGQRGLTWDIVPPRDPEAIRGAKGWLEKHMGRYSETTDQPALTAKLSLEEARNAPSFDKFVREVTRLLGVPADLPPPPAGAFL
jgi:hypothetical protein